MQTKTKPCDWNVIPRVWDARFWIGVLAKASGGLLSLKFWPISICREFGTAYPDYFLWAFVDINVSWIFMCRFSSRCLEGSTDSNTRKTPTGSQRTCLDTLSGSREFAWQQWPMRTQRLPQLGCSFISGGWFGTFLLFPYIGINHPNWLIFFRGVETTTQSSFIIWKSMRNWWLAPALLVQRHQ